MAHTKHFLLSVDVRGVGTLVLDTAQQPEQTLSAILIHMGRTLADHNNDDIRMATLAMHLTDEPVAKEVSRDAASEKTILDTKYPPNIFGLVLGRSYAQILADINYDEPDDNIFLRPIGQLEASLSEHTKLTQSPLYQKARDALIDEIEESTLYPFHPIERDKAKTYVDLVRDYLLDYFEGELHGNAFKKDEPVAEKVSRDVAPEKISLDDVFPPSLFGHLSDRSYGQILAGINFDEPNDGTFIRQIGQLEDSLRTHPQLTQTPLYQKAHQVLIDELEDSRVNMRPMNRESAKTYVNLVHSHLLMTYTLVSDIKKYTPKTNEEVNTRGQLLSAIEQPEEVFLDTHAAEPINEKVLTNTGDIYQRVGLTAPDGVYQHIGLAAPAEKSDAVETPYTREQMLDTFREHMKQACQLDAGELRDVEYKMAPADFALMGGREEIERIISAAAKEAGLEPREWIVLTGDDVYVNNAQHRLTVTFKSPE